MINYLFIINSPLDQFEVINLISINAPLLGYLNISLTNLGLYSFIACFIILMFHYFGINYPKILPTPFSVIVETFYATLLGMVRDQIGITSEKYLPLIYTLFFFIIFANLIGNVPYGFTITTSVIVTIGLSVTIFLGVTILALSIHKDKFFSFFIPEGTPLPLAPLLSIIELISYLARAFSLGIRLFANLLSGHTLLAILSSFLYPMFTKGFLVFILSLIPFALFICIIGLELAVSVIQAYVFTILTCTYLHDAVYLH